MLIRFWCDSDITFLRGLHGKLVTVMYFFIGLIIVLCGAGGDTSFAPQANLYSMKIVVTITVGLRLRKARNS